MENRTRPGPISFSTINPVYGEAYATAAHFFVINRRYDEGVAFYRKALALNPDLWDARSELGLNLMRLGRHTRSAPGTGKGVCRALP